MTAPPASSVRCKFRLTAVETHWAGSYDAKTGQWTPGKTYTLKFSAVGGDNHPENKLFWQYTPSGSFEFTTINESAARMFEFGKSYYADFSPAPD